MSVLMIDPSTVGLVVLFIIVTSAGATFVITKKALKAQGTWNDLRRRHRKVLRKVSSLKKEGMRMGAENRNLSGDKQRLLRELSIEKATQESKIEAAIAVFSLKAIQSVKVRRQLLWRELPKSWWANNYMLQYKETVSVLGKEREQIVVAKFETQVDPQRIIGVLGSAVQLVKLAAGAPGL